MPTLDEKQRAWLDAALAAKGRFTRAASVKKDWEAYRRRRDKVVAGAVGLEDGPQKTQVEAGLKAADAEAEKGRFSAAYKALDGIKALARNASATRAAAISASSLEGRVSVMAHYVNDLENTSDFAVRHFDGLVRQVQAHAKAGDEPDFESALAFRRDFAVQERVLRAELASRQDWIRRVQGQIDAAGLKGLIAEIARDIALFRSLGQDAAVAKAAARFDALKTRAEANGGRLLDSAVLGGVGQTQTKAFEQAMKEIVSLGQYQSRDAAPVPDDDPADDEGRRAKFELAMAMAGLTDATTLDDTARGPVTRAREPASFDADQVLDAEVTRIFGPGGLPDDVPLEKANELVAAARAKIAAFVAGADVKGDEMFDLILSTPEDLARKASLAMTGVESAKGVSASQSLMLAEMGRTMREEVLKACPNRMADDAGEIMVNGTRYVLEEVIGQGGNGAARRYRDPATGKTVVVKSLKGKALNDEDSKARFDSMAEEMRTHRQALNGGPGLKTDDENIVKMEGAAVSADGSLHMILEDAEAGDLGLVGNNMAMLQSMGLLPPEAKNALALDLVAQTVKGMKALEERGLVHNDLKPQNLMLTRDGKVKIIDFGESRFVDEATGEAPTAREGHFNTTPGYEAPEQYKPKNKTVTSKADTYALSGIMKILFAEADEDAVTREMKPVSALGRVTSALAETDPDKRPSLDAVLASSLFEQMEGDHPPEDVAELKAAAAEMNVVMTQAKATVKAQDFRDNTVSGKGMLDSAWAPHANRIQSQGGEVPIALLQTMAPKIELAIANKRKELARSPGQEAEIRQAIADLEKKRAFWAGEVTRQTDALRAKGKAELDTALADKTRQVQVPGKGAMSLGAAMELVRRNAEGIAKVQQDFADFAAKMPEAALARMDEVNRGLAALDAEAKAALATVKAALGPEAKYYLAEQKMVEVAGRFGPRRATPEALARRATPEPPPRPQPQVQPRAPGDSPPPPPKQPPPQQARRV